MLDYKEFKEIIIDEVKAIIGEETKVEFKTVHKINQVSYEGMISVDNKGCTWFSELVKHEWFRNEVLARMNELDDDFENTLTQVKAKADELEESADKNAHFWKMYGKRYHSYVSNDASANLQNYDEHIAFLIDWADKRWDIIKEFLKG